MTIFDIAKARMLVSEEYQTRDVRSLGHAMTLSNALAVYLSAACDAVEAAREEGRRAGIEEAAQLFDERALVDETAAQTAVEDDPSYRRACLTSAAAHRATAFRIRALLQEKR